LSQQQYQRWLHTCAAEEMIGPDGSFLAREILAVTIQDLAGAGGCAGEAVCFFLALALFFAIIKAYFLAL
jgi:hypothetical protein